LRLFEHWLRRAASRADCTAGGQQQRDQDCDDRDDDEEFDEREAHPAGKEYKAQWYDSKGTTEGGESITRTWMAEEVPGLILKAVTQVPKTKKVTTIELIEFKVP
jgi:hypothetical protein